MHVESVSETPTLRGAQDQAPQPNPPTVGKVPLTIRVLRTATNEPIPACNVRLYRIDDRNRPALARAASEVRALQTGADGIATAEWPTTGATLILAENGAFARGRAIVFYPQTDVTISLDVAGTLSGTIRGPDGAALAGVEVYALPDGGPFAHASTAQAMSGLVEDVELPPHGLTNQSGEFRIEGIDSRPHRVALPPSEWQVSSIQGVGAGGVVLQGAGPIQIVASPVRYVAIRTMADATTPLDLAALTMRASLKKDVQGDIAVLEAAELHHLGLPRGPLEETGVRVGRVVLAHPADSLRVVVGAPMAESTLFEARLLRKRDFAGTFEAQEVRIRHGLGDGGFGAVRIRLAGEAAGLVPHDAVAVLRVALDGRTRGQRVAEGDRLSGFLDVFVRGRRTDDHTWVFKGVPAGIREVDASLGPLTTQPVVLNIDDRAPVDASPEVATVSGILLDVRAVADRLPALDYVYSITRLDGDRAWAIPPRASQAAGQSETVALDPGRYRVVINRAGYRASVKEVEVVSNGLVHLPIDLER